MDVFLQSSSEQRKPLENGAAYRMVSVSLSRLALRSLDLGGPVVEGHEGMIAVGLWRVACGEKGSVAASSLSPYLHVRMVPGGLAVRSISQGPMIVTMRSLPCLVQSRSLLNK